MKEIDKVLAFQFNVTVDNELAKDIHLSPSIEDVYTKAAIKLAKQYAAHCMEEQRIICANNAKMYLRYDGSDVEEIDENSILNAPLYNGENYGN